MTEEARFAISAELTKIINPGAQLASEYQITYRDYYDFAGLTASAWCEALKISPETHKKYLSGALSVSQSRLDSARAISFAIRAAATGLLSLESFKYLKKYEDIREIIEK